MSSDSDGEEDGPAMLAALLRQRATPAPTWSQDQGPSATSPPPPPLFNISHPRLKRVTARIMGMGSA